MAEDFEKSRRASEFQKACSDVGMDLLPSADMAALLGISTSYFDQLWRGQNAISAPIRQKLGEIAAKANGQAESDLDEDLAVAHATQAQFCKKRYRVAGRIVRCEEVTFTEVAAFASPVAASEYADWLNDQINRGKEEN